MEKKIAVLLIVLSLSLNAAFIGSWAVRAARGPASSTEARVLPCEGAPCPLHRSLDVTDEQWRRLEPRLARFRSDSESLCRDIRRARGELIDLIDSPLPDRTAIAAKREEILTAQRKMQELVIAHLLAEKEMLNPEQQAKLFRMIRERSGCAGKGGMMFPVSASGAESRAPGESGK